MKRDGGPTPSTRMLRLVHHHPGRIRMRADVFRDGDAAYAKVRQAIAAIPGVQSSEHNPRTGSVLVTYAPGLAEPDAILSIAADAAGLHGVIDEESDPSARFNPGRKLISTVQGINVASHEASGGRADLGFLVPAALAGAAVYSLVANRNPPRWPRWDNLAIWAYTIFLEWQYHHPRREPRAESM